MGTILIANSKTRKKVDNFLRKVFKDKTRTEGFKIDELICGYFIVRRHPYERELTGHTKALEDYKWSKEAKQ